MSTLDLSAEKDAIQKDIDLLNSKIATLQGELKAELKALNIKEEDLESSYAAVSEQLRVAEQEFNDLYLQYEQFKQSLLQPEAAVPFTQPGSSATTFTQPFVQPTN